MRKEIYIVLLSLLMTGSAIAGGFQVRLQGQKQNGMGLIGTPWYFGPSSIFYNPGALSLMDSTFSFSAGVSLVMANAKYGDLHSSYIAETNNPTSPPFYFYGAFRLSEKFTAGIGINTPYGSKSVWEDNWAGKYLIEEIALRAYYFQPTIAYKINDMFSIGAGLVITKGSVDLTKGLPYSETSNVNLKGDSDIKFGFNVGMHVQICERINFGIDYRSKIDVAVEGGDATFEIPASIGGMIPTENKFNASLPMPANLDFGLSFQATDKLLLAVEVNWVMWSEYKELTFTFEEAGETLDNVNPREYKDSWIPRIGAQYLISDKLVVRAGAYYDPSPVNEKYFNPETVSLNTVGLTCGLTYRPIPNLEIDLSYLNLSGLEAERTYEPANFSGNYAVNTSIPGFGITYKF